MRKLRVALCQINSVVGDIDGNIEKMMEYIVEAEEKGANLIVFPELVISGYPPQDALEYDDLNRNLEEAEIKLFRFLQKRRAERQLGGAIVVWGNVRRGVGLRNSGKVFIPGQIVNRFPATRPEYQDKRRLPNYGVFDEVRYFKSGEDEPSKVFVSEDLTFGVSVCEDIWYQQNYLSDFALNGAHLVVNINASPFHVGKPKAREEMLRARASDNQMFVLYCNMVGGQDGIVFDGDSMIISPRGKLLARARLFEEEILYADLDLGEVGRERLRDTRLNNLETSGVETIPFNFFGVGNKAESCSGKVIKTKSRIGQIHDALVLMIRDYIQKQGLKSAVVGVSGGIDSAVVAALAVEALGKENITLIAMPSKYSSEGSITDAQQLASNLRVDDFTISNIQRAVDALLGDHEKDFGALKNPVSEENIQARVRGNKLMMYSNDNPGVIVLSTGNKSEIAVGYCTLYGDMVGGFNPLLDVYKTDVWLLAKYINKKAGYEIIPQETIDKAPSAELRSDQQDTDSLPPYSKLDPLLRLHIEECMTSDEIIASGFCQMHRMDEEDIRKVTALVRGSEFKRQQGVVGSRISPIAFGIGRRMPIVNKFEM